MAISLRPEPSPASLPGEPLGVVHAFLSALETEDADTARALIDDDIDYINVSLPAVKGRAEFDKVLAILGDPRTGFEVYLHSISADGATVLTERTDVLIFGPLRMQFWVWGRFDVVDGRITLWRDSFDFVDLFRGLARGLAALVVPGLAVTPPATPLDPPGRAGR